MNTFNNMLSYISYLMNKNRIELEVRLIEDTIFVEKIGFLKENNYGAIDVDGEIVSEIIDWKYTLLRSIPGITVDGETIKPTEPYSYECNKLSLIYAIWIDIEKNTIIPSSPNVKILNKGCVYTISP